MKHKTILAAIAILSATAVGGAYAANSADNDALAVANAKLSLTQAIMAAEQHVGGKASRAEYEHEKGKAVFEVEVVKDKTVMDVEVDAMSGQVIAAVEDKADGKKKYDKDD